MSKTNKTAPKTNCERYKRHLRAFHSFERNIYKSVKKVIVSRKISTSRHEKSLSTGVLSNKGSQVEATRKTAKSDFIFNQSLPSIDYCKKCGDCKESPTLLNINANKKQLHTDITGGVEKVINKPTNGQRKYTNKNNSDKNMIHQFYRNENFYQSTCSFNATDNIKKVSLNTIAEQPEKVLESDTIYEICPEVSEEFGFVDTEDKDKLKELIKFRKNNFFECHSVKSRINSKSSVNSHQCVYRFYLNDRLFPVPLNTDYQENIRCIECNLPSEYGFDGNKLNGMVQAKVRLKGEVQDTLLMLPVKSSLIVKERRKQSLKDKKDYDSVYFGIIKLDINGNSIFNKTLPSDSLALRYQKGYKELSPNKKIEYDSVNKEDIIIV